MSWAWVAIGGAMGALLRDVATRRRGAVPGTDLVNRFGSVLLGVVVAATDVGVLGPGALELLGVGLAGGMTTFSTWIGQVVDPPVGGGPDWWRLVRETLLGLGLAGVALAMTRQLLG